MTAPTSGRFRLQVDGDQVFPFAQWLREHGVDPDEVAAGAAVFVDYDRNVLDYDSVFGHLQGASLIWDDPVRTGPAPEWIAQRVPPAEPWSAAELPDGSVVATSDQVFIKTWPTEDLPWAGTSSEEAPDWFVDRLLNRRGGVVLRVGY